MVKMLKDHHHVVYVVHIVTKLHNALDEDKRNKNTLKIKNKK
jgi:hypothetical protein